MDTLLKEIETMLNEAKSKRDAAIELERWSEVTERYAYWRGIRDAHRIVRIFWGAAESGKPWPVEGDVLDE